MTITTFLILMVRRLYMEKIHINQYVQLYDFLNELKDVQRLEKVLIARSLFFKKNHCMPTEESPKRKGAICNTPANAVDILKTLSRAANSKGLAIVKLKQKLQYCSHIMCFRSGFAQML